MCGSLRCAAFGHAPTFTGLGLFFDTYDNAAGSHLHKHPWVSAVVGTPEAPGSYDHNDSGGSQQRHGCHARELRVAGGMLA